MPSIWAVGTFTTWLRRNLRTPDPETERRNVALVNPATLSLFQPANGSPSSIAYLPEQALGVPAAYASVRMISKDVAQMPWSSYLRSTNEQTAEQPAILRRPNPFQPVEITRQQLAAALLLRGNAFAWLTAHDRAGRPTVAIPIANDEVVVTWNDQRTGPKYTWRGTELRLYRDVLHLKFLDLGPDHLLGLGPIQANRTALSGALQAESYAEGFYSEAAVPDGVLTTPGTITEDEAKRLREQWTGNRQGSRSTAVLQSGMTFEPITMNNKDAQYVESREHSVADVARMFGIPGAKLGAVTGGTNITYSNVEMIQTQYATDAVRPITEVLEVGFGELLPTTQEVRSDFTALLRADSRTRYSVYALALSNGILTVNEVRAREGLPPVAGGDEIRREAEPEVPREPAATNTGEAGA